MLVEAREKAGCGKNELCRRTGFTFLQLQRIENASNNYKLELPIKYLASVGYALRLIYKGETVQLNQYDDLLPFFKKVRSGMGSLSEVASKVGCAKQSISNIEVHRTIVHIDLLLQLFEFMQIKICLIKSK